MNVNVSPSQLNVSKGKLLLTHVYTHWPSQLTRSSVSAVFTLFHHPMRLKRPPNAALHYQNTSAFDVVLERTAPPLVSKTKTKGLTLHNFSFSAIKWVI